MNLLTAVFLYLPGIYAQGNMLRFSCSQLVTDRLDP